MGSELLATIKHKNALCNKFEWSYVTIINSRELNRFTDILEMQPCDRGYPKNIITIIELINKDCYFNRRIRY